VSVYKYIDKWGRYHDKPSENGESKREIAMQSEFPEDRPLTKL
jgi:hypothetical protein